MTLGTCQSDVECTCAGNPTAAGCARCVLSYLATGNPGEVMPCAPAVGRLTIAGCTACKVDVIGASPDWEIEITGDSTLTTFGSTALGVTGHLFVKAKVNSNGGQIPGLAGQSIGQFQLAISSPGVGTRLMSVALALPGDPPQAMCATSNGVTSMFCAP